MSEERLLERIRNLERNPEQRVSQNLTREVQSVIGYLQRLLNTRQGSSPIEEEFGIPDFTNVPGETLSDTAREMERTIRQVIQKFEPCLAGVKVTFLPQSDELMSLRFKIEANLARAKSVSVAFETVVSSEGRVKVSE
jgi:type VI secretion system protein